jgi:formylglycine-generating enzyme required for sulfatase activity
MRENNQLTIPVNAGIPIDLSWCLPGAFNIFTRGTSLFYKVKREKVRVEFSKGFWLSEIPVTVNIWNAVLGDSPRNRFKGMNNDNSPVFGIDYREADFFLEALNQLMKDKKQNVVFSLPNYLEWLYACEAKSDENETRFWRDHNDFFRYAWFKDNSGYSVREVAKKLPNPWGIYDMYGNILEMCIDVAAENGVETIVDPSSVIDQDTFTIIGGSYLSTFEECQITKRRSMSVENSFIEPLGLRLICKEILHM